MSDNKKNSSVANLKCNFEVAIISLISISKHVYDVQFNHHKIWNYVDACQNACKGK